MYLESQLKVATNDYFHVMSIPKHQSCYVTPGGGEAIIAGVITNLPGCIFNAHVSIEGQKDKFTFTFTCPGLT